MAAHDCDVYFPFDAGAGSSVLESQWRLMASNWLTDGPIRGELSNFAASTTSGRNIIISAGRAWVRGAFAELSTAFTQPFGTNTSGNPRIDRVVLRNDFTANKVVLDVLVGTPGASPNPPALTQNTSIWEISLCQVTLANGYTAIVAGNINTDAAFAQGRPPGGPTLIGCAVVLGGTPITVPEGSPFALVLSTAASATEDYDTGAIHSLSSNQSKYFVTPGCPGLWAVDAAVTFDVDNTTAHWAMYLYKNGVSLRTLDDRPGSTFSMVRRLAGHSDEPVVAGDYFEVFVYHNGSGSSRNIVDARVAVRFLGPIA